MRVSWWITAVFWLLTWLPQAFGATAIYVVTKAGSLYRSTDGARSWQQLPIQGVDPAVYNSTLAIDPQNPSNLYVYLEFIPPSSGGKGSPSGPSISNMLFRSTDGGQSWNKTELPATAIIRQLIVDPASPNVVYAAGSNLYRSTDSGATFNQTSVSN